MNSRLCRLQIYNFDRILSESEAKYDEIKSTEKFLKKKNKGTQTDYRESEAQTDPYALKIPSSTCLGWADGQHEIEKIKKIRIKKSWEALVSPMDYTNRETREFIINMIDQEEWTFRDQELEQIANWRLDAMEDILKFGNQQRELKVSERFENVGKYLNEIRETKIAHIKQDCLRNLEKLSDKYLNKGAQKSFNIQKSYSLKKAESFKKLEFDDEKFKSGEDLIDKELWLEDYNEDDKKSNLITQYLSKNPLKSTKRRARMSDDLCMRETRWSDEQLKNLHHDLKKIRLDVTEANF